MLYKKYHRNYVSQFKKGVKLNIINKYRFSSDSFINSKVIKEPFIDIDYSFAFGISIVDSCNYKLFIVYRSGKFNYRITIVE